MTKYNMQMFKSNPLFQAIKPQLNGENWNVDNLIRFCLS